VVGRVEVAVGPEEGARADSDDAGVEEGAVGVDVDFGAYFGLCFLVHGSRG
jgi:hypothetical protein